MVHNRDFQSAAMERHAKQRKAVGGAFSSIDSVGRGVNQAFDE